MRLVLIKPFCRIPTLGPRHVICSNCTCTQFNSHIDDVISAVGHISPVYAFWHSLDGGRSHGHYVYEERSNNGCLRDRFLRTAPGGRYKSRSLFCGLCFLRCALIHVSLITISLAGTVVVKEGISYGCTLPPEKVTYGTVKVELRVFDPTATDALYKMTWTEKSPGPSTMRILEESERLKTVEGVKKWNRPFVSWKAKSQPQESGEPSWKKSKRY